MRLKKRMMKLAYNETTYNFPDDYTESAKYKPEDQQNWKKAYSLIHEMRIPGEIKE